MMDSVRIMEWLREWASQVFLADLPLSKRVSYLGFSLALFVNLTSQQCIGPVKTALFFDIVGADLEPLAKSLILAVLIPVLFVYNVLSSMLTSKWLVLAVCASYGVIYLGIGLWLFGSSGHPATWLPWLLYFATETKGVIIMPMIWSVVVDATPPEMAKAAFPPIFVVIQLGGILGSLVAIKVSSLGGEVGLIILQALFLILVVAFTFLACHFNPPSSEAEASEDAERQPLVNGQAGSLLAAASPARRDDRSCLGMGVEIFSKGMEGLWLLLSRPYVFMTFWVSYATLMPRTVLDYENQALVDDHFADRDQKVAYLGRINLIINCGVLVMALVGTRFIVERFGMRFSLTVLPVAMMCCVMWLCTYYSLQSSAVVVVVSSIIAYGLNSPCKEMLYVRTTREIKYKAKSWSEMYGNQVMKLLGAQINLWVNRRGPSCGNSCFHPKTTASVVAAWVTLWFGIAMTLGQEHGRLEQEKKYVS